MGAVKKGKLRNHYVVEDIISFRRVSSQNQYKVKWSNYPLSQASWEPENELYRCLDLVNDYRRMHNMPPIFIPQAVDASSDAARPEMWKTLPEILSLTRNLLIKDGIKAKVEIWSHQESAEGVTYIFASDCHAYVIKRRAHTLYLADGANLCQKGGAWEDLDQAIGDSELNIVTLSSHQQMGEDDCACSAVGIAYAFARDRLQNLWAPQTTVNLVRKTLGQNGVGDRSSALNRKIFVCTICNRRLKNGLALSNHLRAHRRNLRAGDIMGHGARKPRIRQLP